MVDFPLSALFCIFLGKFLLKHKVFVWFSTAPMGCWKIPSTLYEDNSEAEELTKTSRTFFKTLSGINNNKKINKSTTIRLFFRDHHQE